MAFKSSASPGRYNQLIDTNLAFADTRRLQKDNEKKDIENREHTKFRADRNRNNLNTLKFAQDVGVQSRNLALPSERRLIQTSTQFEQQRIKDAQDSAYRNATAKAKREANAAQEIGKVLNDVLDTGYDFYNQLEAERLEQEKKDLNILTLKYGISTQDQIAINSLTKDMWLASGQQEGIVQRLRSQGMTWDEISRIQGASEAARAAVAINQVNSDIAGATNRLLLSEDLVPGLNKTVRQLVEEGDIAGLEVAWRLDGARLFENAANLGITDIDQFVRAHTNAKTTLISLARNAAEAKAKSEHNAETRQQLMAVNKSGDFTGNMRARWDGAALQGNAVSTIKNDLKQTALLIQQGVLPLGTYDQLRNIVLGGSGQTVESHGAYNEELLEVLKAERAWVRGENSETSANATYALNTYKENVAEFSKFNRNDQDNFIIAEANRLQESGDPHWMNKIAHLKSIRDATPEVKTPSQRAIEVQRSQNNGSYALVSDEAIRAAYPDLKSQNDILKKKYNERITYQNSFVLPTAKDLANPRSEQGSIEGRGHWTNNWMEKDVAQRFWKRSEVYERSLSPQEAMAKAMADMKADFGDDKHKGHYAVFDLSKPEEAQGRKGFKAAWKEQGDAMSPASQGPTYREKIKILSGKTIADADLSRLNIDADQLKNQLNPNTPWSTHVARQVNDIRRITGFKGTSEEAMIEMITNLTDQTYTPPAVKVELSPRAKLLQEQLIARGLPIDIGVAPVRGQLASSPMKFGSAQGWALDPQSPGIDVYPVEGDHVVAPFSGGVVVDKGYDYNPNGIGGDGRQGVGWGNWIKVQHTDPTTGGKFDVLYAHFPNGELDRYQKGSQIPQYHRIGRLATGQQFDNRSDGVGSGMGVHQSMDFYTAGTWSGYNNIPALVNYIKSLGGNQPQQTSTEPPVQPAQPQQQQPSNQVNTTDKYVAKEHKPGEPLTEEGVRNPDHGADVRITKGGIKFWFTDDGKLNMMTPDGKTKREALGEISINMLEVLEADEVVNNKGGLW